MNDAPAAPGDETMEETNEAPAEKDTESEVDEESVKSYLDSLSPAECHYAYEQLKAKYEGDDSTKMSMADIAAGK